MVYCWVPKAMALVDDLASAAATGNTAGVEDLLRRGAEVNGVNKYGRTPLQVSVDSGRQSPGERVFKSVI